MAITFNADPMTELEAVNTMLLSIGKAPVNTLTIAGINDVSFAQQTLYTVCREVQSRKWWFNREPHFLILPTAQPNGQILIPDSCIDITTSDRTKHWVERNGMLYDLDKHTFNIGQYFPAGVHCDLVWCFPFEQIPQVARSFIARRAGRQFQAGAVGSQVIYQFTKEMELDAAAELERAETKNSKTNMFTANTQNNKIVNRQPGAYRRPW